MHTFLVWEILFIKQTGLRYSFIWNKKHFSIIKNINHEKEDINICTYVKILDLKIYKFKILEMFVVSGLK